MIYLSSLFNAPNVSQESYIDLKAYALEGCVKLVVKTLWWYWLNFNVLD